LRFRADYLLKAHPLSAKILARRRIPPDSFHSLDAIRFCEGRTMREDLIASLRKIIVNDLFVEIAESDIGIDDGLRTVVGLDSVGFVELRVLCEQKFNVEISDDDYTPENFTSIRLLSNLIDGMQAQRTAAAAVAL
jgi:acyl carrier protein